MKARLLAAFALVLGVSAPAAEKQTFTFDTESPGGPPAGWTFGRTGQGKPGRWIVEDGKTFEGRGNVLVQREADSTDNRFPVAFAPRARFTDGTISVRCRPLSGTVDQGCGVVLRATDENEYVVARATALEDNVRLYDVTKGSRRQFAGWNGKVAPGVWHTLSLSAKSEAYVVTFDGTEVLRASSGAQKGPGKAGLWTKADSVIAFDDVVVEIHR